MSNNIPINNTSGFRYQANMPNNKNSFRANDAMVSTELQLATVISVNYPKMMAQVTTQSSVVAEATKQQYGAMMPMEFFNSNLLGEVYGTYRPIAVGSTVLIGFLNGNTNTPIILGVYFPNSEAVLNIAPTDLTEVSEKEYPVRDEVLTQKTVFPSQQIELNSEKGNYLRTFNGRSLLMVDQDDFGKLSDITFDGTADLRLHKVDKNRTLYNVPVQAQRMLLLHQSNTDKDLHRTRFYIDKDGTSEALWLDAQEQTKLVGMQGNKDSGLEFFFLHDTIDHSNSTTYSKISLNYNNKILLEALDKNAKGSIEVTPNGTTIDGVKVASESNFATLSTKFTQLQNRLDSITAEVEAVGQGYIASLPDKIASLNRDISTNNREITSVKDSLKDVTSASDAANTKIDTLRQDVKTSLDKVNNQIAGLQSLVSNYNTVSNLAYSLKGRVDILEGVAQDYQKRSNSFLTADSNLITSLSNAQTSQATKLNSMQTALTTVESNITTIKTDLSNLHASIDAGNTNNSDHEAIVQLQQQYTQLATDVAAIKAQLQQK